MRRDELNVALAGLGGAERRAKDFVGAAPGVPVRLAVTECVMWADAIRDELGIRSHSLTVENMPRDLFGDRLDDRSEREQAVKLIHGFRWARNRALHERLLKVEGVGGGMRTPFVTPLVTHPAECWLWDETSEARPKPEDPRGADGYAARLLGREVHVTMAEVRQLYELGG